MKLVLEGIEDEKDLAVAKMLGVHIGQGFLLGKPSEYDEVYYRERRNFNGVYHWNNY